MTKINGHIFYDQNFGHLQSGMSTSYPTWPILRGSLVTKSNGPKSKPAQSTLMLYMGQAQQFSLFIFFLAEIVSYMSQAQHFIHLTFGP
jgi:hypothetical protein